MNDERLSTTVLVAALSIFASTKAGRVFDQRADRGVVAGALDQVASSMARDETILGLWRAGMDALHVSDLAASVVTPTARFAYLIGGAKAGDQFALELAAGID